jgi:3-isopropylmalate/(R)-2-methylmalate dehydratase small subunit
MRSFRTHRGRVAPLLRRDVDTDQIVPKQFLKRLERTGFGEFLFYDWRTTNDGAPDGSFVLNQPRFTGASILVAGPNFGCGSSREHAAWALQDFGFQAVIAPSFADIFRANAIANGLLPLALPEDVVGTIAKRAAESDAYELEIDLEACQVKDSHGLDQPFDFESGARERLLEGLDDIGLILKYEHEIAAYERRQGSHGSHRDHRNP